MTRRIVLADTMGYCWGVRRTLEIIQDAGDLNDPVATIGDVIHNPQVVDRLRAYGVDTAESIREAADRGFRRVAITAHGAGPHMANEAREAGVELLDTTCPLVTKVQRMAQKFARQGYTVIIYGDAYHPEVKGIVGWSGTSRVHAAKKMSDLPWTTPRGSVGSSATNGTTPSRKVAVVSQTTKNTDEFLRFITDLTALVSPEGGEVRIANTICEPTFERQNALKKLAGEVDIILAVGGHKSSNTARLAEVGRTMGVESHHIERATEIDDTWLAGKSAVGITAGASTPDDVIESVVHALQHRGYAPPEVPLHTGSLEEVPAY